MSRTLLRKDPQEELLLKDPEEELLLKDPEEEVLLKDHYPESSWKVFWLVLALLGSDLDDLWRK